jgi:hypothetical protein
MCKLEPARFFTTFTPLTGELSTGIVDDLGFWVFRKYLSDVQGKNVHKPYSLPEILYGKG